MGPVAQAMTRRIPSTSTFTGDRIVDDSQRATSRVAGSLNTNPFSTGVLLDTDPAAGSVKGAGIAFATSTQRSIPHGLGRAPTGFIVVDSVSSAGVISRVESDANTITLISSAATTAKVWVF